MMLRGDIPRKIKIIDNTIVFTPNVKVEMPK